MGYGRQRPSRRGFSRRPGPPDIAPERRPSSHLTLVPHGFAYGTGCVLDHGKPPPRPAPIPCHPCALTYQDYIPNNRAPRTPKGTTPRDRRLVLIRSALAVRCRYGNIHPFIHSTTPVGLALGPDSPGDDERGPGTLGHPADGILTRLSLLMSAFSLPRSPRRACAAASPLGGRSPTQQQKTVAASSVVCLSPATLSARNH